MRRKMSDIICEKCGYKTFAAYALKDDKGRLICPQCSELYKEDPTTLKSSFKFKQEDNPSPPD
jgi:hypothetical protein